MMQFMPTVCQIWVIDKITGQYLGLGVPLDLAAAQRHDNLVDHTVGGIQQNVHNERDDNRRHKAGKNDHGVIKLQCLFGAEIVEHQSQSYRADQIQDQEGRAVKNRIPNGSHRILRGEKELEVIQPAPLAAPDA